MDENAVLKGGMNIVVTLLLQLKSQPLHLKIQTGRRQTILLCISVTGRGLGLESSVWSNFTSWWE